ncbi:hypothetical protein M2157_008637 [Streptomyces sp. SAI-127]|nr:hypothetical protein [Streptomyces sp. SAI-127]
MWPAAVSGEASLYVRVVDERVEGFPVSECQVRGCWGFRVLGGSAVFAKGFRRGSVSRRSQVHKILVTASYRRTRGIPRPIHEMISRWISLLPPPKVKITAER